MMMASYYAVRAAWRRWRRTRGVAVEDVATPSTTPSAGGLMARC